MDICMYYHFFHILTNELVTCGSGQILNNHQNIQCGNSERDMIIWVVDLCLVAGKYHLGRRCYLVHSHSDKWQFSTEDFVDQGDYSGGLWQMDVSFSILDRTWNHVTWLILVGRVYRGWLLFMILNFFIELKIRVVFTLKKIVYPNLTLIKTLKLSSLHIEYLIMVTKMWY